MLKVADYRRPRGKYRQPDSTTATETQVVCVLRLITLGPSTRLNLICVGVSMCAPKHGCGVGRGGEKWRRRRKVNNKTVTSGGLKLSEEQSGAQAFLSLFSGVGKYSPLSFEPDNGRSSWPGAAERPFPIRASSIPRLGE